MCEVTPTLLLIGANLANVSHLRKIGFKASWNLGHLGRFKFGVDRWTILKDGASSTFEGLQPGWNSKDFTTQRQVQRTSWPPYTTVGWSVIFPRMTSIYGDPKRLLHFQTVWSSARDYLNEGASSKVSSLKDQTRNSKSHYHDSQCWTTKCF